MNSNSLVCWSAQYSLLHLLPGFAPEKSISLRKSKVSKTIFFFKNCLKNQISTCSDPLASGLELLFSSVVSVSPSPSLGVILLFTKSHLALCLICWLACGGINQKSLSHLCLALLIEELRSSSFLKSCRLEQTVFWEFAQKRSILRKKYFPFLLNSCSS